VAFRNVDDDVSMDDTLASPSPRPSRVRGVGLVAAGLVGGLVLAGLGVAGAQSGDPAPAPSGSPKAERLERGPHRFPFRHGGRHGGPGRRVLHGEYVTRDGDGGYQTHADQRGEATAVSATSITVKSEDGFTRTYVIDGDTRIGGAYGEQADLAVGDEVHVFAVLDGGTARARRIGDITDMKRGHERLRSDPRPSGEPSKDAA
jgi:hypothetical protein